MLVALEARDRLVLRADLVAARDDLQAVRRATARLRAAPQVERAAAGHEPQVGAEVAAAGVERPRAAPEPQEHVLRDVLGGHRVPEHAQRRPVDGGTVLVVGAGEGRRVGEVHACRVFIVPTPYTTC